MIGCKWVFTIKVRPTGSIDSTKHDWLQKVSYKHMDLTIYTETCVPITKLNTIHVLLPLVAKLD